MTLVAMQARRELASRGESVTVERPHYLTHSSMRLSGHVGPVNECVFAPNGTLMGSCASELILWSLTEGSVVSRGCLRHHKFPITSLSFSRDSLQVATASADQTVAVIDSGTGKILRRLKEHSSIVNTVAFLRSPRDSLIVSGDDDGLIIVHDVRQKEIVHQLKTPFPVVSMAVSASHIAIGSVYGGVSVHSINDHGFHVKHELACPSIVFGCAIDPSERYVATCEEESCVTLFDAQALPVSPDRVVAKIDNGEYRREVVPSRIVFSSDGRFLMAGAVDSVTRIWDVENVADPQLVRELKGHNGSVTGVSFHPELPIVASSSTDATVIVREIN